MGPTLDFDTKQRNSFLIKFGVFYNKSKILTILIIVKYEKNHTFKWVFNVVGAHNQQVFCMFKWEEKHKQKQRRVLAPVLSLWVQATDVAAYQVEGVSSEYQKKFQSALSSPSLETCNQCF
jgi:hypothetical protein